MPAALAADGSRRDLRGELVDLIPQALAAGLPSSLNGLPTVAPGRFGPPLVGIGKIVCIGLNYRSHAREIGSAAPSEPMVFLKAPDTVVGTDDVLIPRTSTKTDWEVELGVVISRTARYLDDEKDALAHVAGYTSATTSPNARFRWSAAASGTRARTARPSTRWARGS